MPIKMNLKSQIQTQSIYYWLNKDKFISLQYSRKLFICIIINSDFKSQKYKKFLKSERSKYFSKNLL